MKKKVKYRKSKVSTVLAVRLPKAQAHLILAKYGTFSEAIKQNLPILMAS